MKNTDEIFKFNLRRLIDNDGRKLEKLAEKCEMSVSMLNQLLSGSSGYSRKTIEHLCTGLKCRPSEFFIDKESIVESRADLILSIQSRLATLDYDELRTISAAIDDLASINGASRAKTAVAD